ncbi:unnamed protein product [Nezara viridula]|uniref:Uncharacterized protein n=1 Tax=Nezara viridula TaxID=85310 RepID=A0A9P0HMT1_NEZVI|nr:unnamed protein product [Nezara viridula]
MSADLMFDSDSSLSPASAEVRDLMEFGVGHWMLDYLSDGESTDWTDEETDTEDEIQECIDVVEDQTNKESCSGTLSEEEVKDSEDVSNGVEIKTNDPAVEDHNDEPAILDNPIEQDVKNREETSNGIQVEPNDPAVEDQNGERTIIYDPIEQLFPSAHRQYFLGSYLFQMINTRYPSFIHSILQFKHVSDLCTPFHRTTTFEYSFIARSTGIPCILYPPCLFLVLIQIPTLPIPSHNPK